MNSLSYLILCIQPIYYSICTCILFQFGFCSTGIQRRTFQHFHVLPSINYIQNLNYILWIKILIILQIKSISVLPHTLNHWQFYTFKYIYFINIYPVILMWISSFQTEYCGILFLFVTVNVRGHLKFSWFEGT